MKKISRILLAMLSLTVTVNAYAGGEDHRRLEMDQSSDVILGQEDLNFVTKPAYPRLRHLEDGTYLLAWQEVIIGRKDDNGRYISYALSSDLKDSYGPTLRGQDSDQILWQVFGEILQLPGVSSACGRQPGSRVLLLESLYIQQD